MLDMFMYHGMSITSFILMLVRYPRLIYKSNKSGMKLIKTFKIYNPPYELPKYNNKMYFCNSKEKYLRSTRLCKSRDENIIAMANKLGSNDLPTRKFTQQAFEFVRNSIKLRFVPIRGAVETLKTGYGICHDQSCLFIALCRSAGIPARYKIYRLEGYRSLFGQVIENENETQLINGLSILASMAVLAEVEIEGKWMICDVITSPEASASSNSPVVQFGEDFTQSAIGKPIMIKHFEELPYRIVFISNLAFKMLKGIFDGHIRVSFEKLLEIGRKRIGNKTLDEIGIKEYNKKAMKSYNLLLPLDVKRED